MRGVIVVFAVAALVLAAAVAVSGPGAQFHLWSFRDGLGILRRVASPIAGDKGLAVLTSPLIAATLLSFIGFVLAVWRARGLALFAGFAFFTAAAATYVPLEMRNRAVANPVIHDITTDFGNPPAIVIGAGAQRVNPAEYAGDAKVPNSNLTVALAQRQAFPDIKPLILQVDRDKAVARTRAVLAEMQIIILGEHDDEATGAHVIEGVSTSRWFGFKDDFIVRIAPQAEGGVKIDVRSESRVGSSDLGANARRVRVFLTKMRSE